MSERKCDICGEDYFPNTKGDGMAEMVSPETMRAIEAGEIGENDGFESITCHYSCGLGLDYTLA